MLEETVRQPSARRPGDETPSRGRSLLGSRRTSRFADGPPGLLFDGIVVSLALLLSAGAAPTTNIGGMGFGWVGLFIAVTLVSLGAGGAYRRRLTPDFLDDLRAIAGATAVASLVVTFGRELLTNDPHVAARAVRDWLFVGTYLAGARAGAVLVQKHMLRTGRAGRRTLIVGAGHVGRRVAERLFSRPEYGLRPVAFFDENPLDPGSLALPVFGVGPGNNRGHNGAESELAQTVRELSISHVILTFWLSDHQRQLELIHRCHDLGISVSLVPRLWEGVPDQTRLERLGGIPLIALFPSDPRGWGLRVKYVLDRTFATIALVILAPLLLLIATGILLTMGRPVLLRQRRVALGGREFDMLKFRTMSLPGAVPDNAASEVQRLVARDLAPGGIEGSDRRTGLGAFLRTTSLDELAQLINVLRGEMSLVGPRPERVAFVDVFHDTIERYADRHRLKAGLTGWSQIHGLRGKTSLRDRVEWDNYYVENWSPWLDLKILLRTPLALFRYRSE